MRGTDERVALAVARTRILDRRRERRRVAGLSALSGGLLTALLVTIGRFSGAGHGLPTGELTGASLLADSAGGYVLVAVLSFAAAVAVTTMCFRYRRRHDEKWNEKRTGIFEDTEKKEDLS